MIPSHRRWGGNKQNQQHPNQHKQTIAHNGKNLLSTATSYLQKYPLHYAASIGDIDTIVSIFDEARTELIDNDILRTTILKKDCNNDCIPSNYSYCSALVNSRDGKGRTPLHWSARNGQDDVCRLLLNTYHADIHASSDTNSQTKRDRGVTPLELCVWQNHVSTAEILIEMGRRSRSGPKIVDRVNGYGCGIYHWCALSPSFAARQTADGDVAAAAKDVWSLMTLLQSSSIHSAETCRRININTPNHHGQTLLHKAAYAGNMPMLAYLLRPPGMPHTAPIHVDIHASISSHANTGVQVQANDPMMVLDDALDEDGNTAADCAERSGRRDVASWVRRFACPMLVRAVTETLDMDITWRPRCLFDWSFGDVAADTAQMDGAASGASHTVCSSGACHTDKHTNDSSSWSSCVVWLPHPPPLDRIRTKYLTLAKKLHPDAAASASSVEARTVAPKQESSWEATNASWFQLHAAYVLLQDWWLDPMKYDLDVKSKTRNRNILQHQPLLLTMGPTESFETIERKNSNNISQSTTSVWMKQSTVISQEHDTPESLNSTQNSSRHSKQPRNNANPTDERKQEELSLFIMRLHKLLLSPNYQQNGLPIDRLPRLYAKCYGSDTRDVGTGTAKRSTHNALPNPKDYKCRKLLHLIQQKCQTVCRVVKEPNTAVLWPKR